LFAPSFRNVVAWNMVSLERLVTMVVYKYDVKNEQYPRGTKCKRGEQIMQIRKKRKREEEKNKG